MSAPDRVDTGPSASLRSERWRLRRQDTPRLSPSRSWPDRRASSAWRILAALQRPRDRAATCSSGRSRPSRPRPRRRLEPPSAAILFGTDELGRDMLNLTVHGARISMSIGFLATLITIVVGALIGIVVGLRRRPRRHRPHAPDGLLPGPADVRAGDHPRADHPRHPRAPRRRCSGMRATLLVIVVVIGITSWATTARIIRSQTLSIKERMFVDRARVIGSGPGHIMRRHILPERREPHRGERRPHVRCGASSPRRASRSSAWATRSTVMGPAPGLRPRTPERPASGRGGTSRPRRSASCSSCSRSRSSATPSTTSSTRSRGRGDDRSAR